MRIHLASSIGGWRQDQLREENWADLSGASDGPLLLLTELAVSTLPEAVVLESSGHLQENLLLQMANTKTQLGLGAEKQISPNRASPLFHYPPSAMLRVLFPKLYLEERHWVKGC